MLRSRRHARATGSPIELLEAVLDGVLVVECVTELVPPKQPVPVPVTVAAVPVSDPVGVTGGVLGLLGQWRCGSLAAALLLMLANLRGL